MEFRDALLAIANRCNFPNESELLEVRAAIVDFFAEPDTLDGEENNVVKLNADPDGGTPDTPTIPTN